MSATKTVAEAFMPELMVLMAADKMADTSKPTKPGGTLVTMKCGITLSP